MCGHRTLHRIPSGQSTKVTGGYNWEGRALHYMMLHDMSYESVSLSLSQETDGASVGPHPITRGDHQLRRGVCSAGLRVARSHAGNGGNAELG